MGGIRISAYVFLVHNSSIAAFRLNVSLGNVKQKLDNPPRLWYTYLRKRGGRYPNGRTQSRNLRRSLKGGRQIM